MEIEYKGGNCITISRKKDLFVVDPKLSLVGLKDFSQGSAQLATETRFVADLGDAITVSSPGEYEVDNCSIKGIEARRHSASDDSDKSSTMYRLDMDDLSLAIMGHIDPNLSEAQLEALGVVDVMVIPVGGFGYTLDSKEAAELVRKIEPKIVIPTHFADEKLKYEVPQDTLENFIKELAGVASETTNKLKLKAASLPASLTLYRLTITR